VVSIKNKMRELKIVNTITKRTPTLMKYLQEVQKEKMITPEEEVELARKIKEGDRVSLEKLVRANLRFVVSVANQYPAHDGLTLSDLINEGNIGLIKAAQRFDETLGFKFISYAVWWIRQSIISSINKESSMIRIPTTQWNIIKRIKKGTSSLEQILGRRPYMEEVSEYLDLPIEKIEELIKISLKHTSLDIKISDDDEDSIMSMIIDEDSPEPDKEVMNNSLIFEVQRVMSTLPIKERTVIEMIYGIGMNRCYTIDEISKKFNVTEDTIRRIRDKSLYRMKHSKKSKRLLESYC
jgi:RNA polymerase primary sigma factor